jgi:hypothetical protein
MPDEKIRLIFEAVDKTEGTFSSLNRSLSSLKNTFTSLIPVLGTISVGFLAMKVKDHIVDVTRMAGKYEMLGITMQQAGQNAGYTAEQMRVFEATLRKTGIAAIESRQILTRMAASNMDLAQSSKLARAAQDLAVVGSINSSEAFERLIHAIQSAQVEMLRNIGLNVTFEAGYKKTAEQLGKNVNELTEAEKMQSRMNTVMEAAANYTGIYEKSLFSAAKQMGSLQRHIYDYKVTFGKAFQPAYLRIVEAKTEAYKKLRETVSDPKFQEAMSDLAEIFAIIYEVGSKLPGIIIDIRAKLRELVEPGIKAMRDDLQDIYNFLKKIHDFAVEKGILMYPEKPEFPEAIITLPTELWSEEQKKRWISIFEELKKATAEVGDETGKVDEKIQKLRETYGSLLQQFKREAELVGLEGIEAKLVELGQLTQDWAKEFGSLGPDAVKKLEDAFRKLLIKEIAYQKQKEAMEAMEKATEEGIEEIKQKWLQFDEDRKKAIENNIDKQITVYEALEELEEKLSDKTATELDKRLREEDKFRRELMRLNFLSAQSYEEYKQRELEITELIEKRKAEIIEEYSISGAEKAVRAFEKSFFDLEGLTKRTLDSMATFIEDTLSGRAADGFKSFCNTIKGMFARLLAEMITMALARPVVVPIVTMMQQTMGGIGQMIPGMGYGGMGYGGITNLLGQAAMYGAQVPAWGGSAAIFPTAAQGGWFPYAQGTLGAGLLGYGIGSMFGGYGSYGGALGGIGGMLGGYAIAGGGSIAAGMAAGSWLGPAGMIGGAILGGILGGLFEDEEDIPKIFASIKEGIIRISGDMSDEVEGTMAKAMQTIYDTMLKGIKALEISDEQINKILNIEKWSQHLHEGESLQEATMEFIQDMINKIGKVIGIDFKEFQKSGEELADTVISLLNTISVIKGFGKGTEYDVRKIYEDINLYANIYQEALDNLDKQIREAVTGLAGLTGVEYREQLENITGLIQQRYQAEFEYLNYIKQFYETLKNTIRKIIEDFRVYLMKPAEQWDYFLAKFKASLNTFINETDATKMATAFKDMESSWQVLLNYIQQFNSLVSSFEQWLLDVELQGMTPEERARFFNEQWNRTIQRLDELLAGGLQAEEFGEYTQLIQDLWDLLSKAKQYGIEIEATKVQTLYDIYIKPYQEVVNKAVIDFWTNFETVARDKIDIILGLQQDAVDILKTQIQSINWSPLYNLSAAAEAATDSLNNLSKSPIFANIPGAPEYTQHQFGLDYVPYSNYHAVLHEGEAVITASGNKALAAIAAGIANLNSSPVVINVSGDIAPFIEIAAEEGSNRALYKIRKRPGIIR